MTAPTIDAAPAPKHQRPAVWKRYAILAAFLLFAAFWVWALFFASKDAVNRIGDRDWAARAESICAATTEAREELADYTRIDEPTPELMRQRADAVDAATDLLEAMLADVMAELPNDPKGADLVPTWAADYRTYIADRRSYADELRTTGRNTAFFETAEQGIPLSDRVATFAGDNEMPSCSPPNDLS